ncbi:MAG: tetratricopeptide repeat protein [Acidobacteriaceae bacterium]
MNQPHSPTAVHDAKSAQTVPFVILSAAKDLAVAVAGCPIHRSFTAMSGIHNSSPCSTPAFARIQPRNTKLVQPTNFLREIARKLHPKQPAKFVILSAAKNLAVAVAFAFALVAAPAASAQYNLPAGAKAPDDSSETQATQQPDANASQLSAAEDLLAKQDYVGARKTLAAYAAQHPKDARALYDLGFAEDALDHTAAAETAYRQAIAADPKQFESHLALGLLLARQNDADAASKELETAITLTPAGGDDDAARSTAKAEAYRALAKLDAASKPGTALEALLAALKISPETPQDTLLAAELAGANGDPAGAEAAYHRLLQAQPDNAAAQSALAHLLVQEKKLPEAEALLSSALKTHPDDPALNAQLAALYGAEGKPEQALPMLVKLHADQPQEDGITRMLADLYTEMGRPADADSLYTALLSKGNPSAGLLAARGDNLIRQKRYAEAEPILKAAVALKPDLADAWSGLAFASSENHDPSTTLQALSMRSKYLLDNASTLFLYATAYDMLHRNKDAADYYRRFLTAANGKFPDQEFQARHRLVALAHMH